MVSLFKKNSSLPFLFLFVSLISVSFIFPVPIESMSLDMSAKILNKGKYVAVAGQIFYKKSGGLMVTKFTKPSETITITNANGEMKIYDIKANTVMQMQGLDFSSENSFFYYFLSGKTQDMGLKSTGFKLESTKIEDGMVVTQWVPNKGEANELSRIEMVHEKYKPIFMAFYNLQKKVIKKTYYTNYQKVQDISFPLNITEFSYTTKGDSTITRRLYSNVKTNKDVDESVLNFKIPSDAKVLTPPPK